MSQRLRLLRGATVLTMDHRTPSGLSDVLLRGDRIVTVAPGLEVGDAELIGLEGCVVLPGLVNAHIHTWQSCLRGLAPDVTLGAYFRAIHDGLGPAFEPGDTYCSTLSGALDQLAGGVTTLFDWHHNNRSVEHGEAAIRALRDSGIRAVYGHGLRRPIVAHDHAAARTLRRNVLQDDSGRVRMALAIAGPGASDLATVASDIALARDLDVRWTLHTGAAGVPPVTPDGVARMADVGLLGADGDFVHANTYSDDDLQRVLDAGATITAAPEIEMQMGHGDPVTARVAALGGSVALGVDTVCCIAPDMLAVGRVAMSDARGRLYGHRGDGAVPDGRAMLRMLTQGNADRIGLGLEIGSITAGKRADLAAFRSPVFDGLSPDQIASCFVSQITAADCVGVWVDGRYASGIELRDRSVPGFPECRARMARRLACNPS